MQLFVKCSKSKPESGYNIFGHIHIQVLTLFQIFSTGTDLVQDFNLAPFMSPNVHDFSTWSNITPFILSEILYKSTSEY